MIRAYSLSIKTSIIPLLALILLDVLLGCAGGQGSLGSGVSGSTSRFALVGDYLYVLDGSNLETLSLENQESPSLVATLEIDQFVSETLFSDGEMLFIGTEGGVRFVSLDDPVNPDFIGFVDHIVAKDPVVTSGTIAYATIRSSGNSRRMANSLLIIDFSDPAQATIINQLELNFPWGLGVQDDILYVCDGYDGLKVIDVSDPLNLSMLYTVPEEICFDVVVTDTTLFTTGMTGINQYQLSQEAEQISFISSISIKTSESP